MLKLITIVMVAIVVILVAIGIIFYIRRKNFKPTPDKNVQHQELNALIKAAGFAYSRRGDYFYSLHDCWQRETGYCKLYDEAAPLFNMIMDREPITFRYNGKRWLLELWKGQYGITTGAEIGLYNTDREDIHTDAFTGTFYHAVSDNEQIKMSFVLYKNGKPLLKRSGWHWWLTAFKLGEFSKRRELVMDAKLVFPTVEMCSAFVDALLTLGYTEKEFHIYSRGRAVQILFDKPHTVQPLRRGAIRAKTVQAVNKNNCAAYHLATAGFTDTLDKLEFLKSFAPDLFDFAINSLYGKAFYDAFRWLFDKHPKPEKPEKPCHPCIPCCPPCEHTGCSCADFCKERCKRMKQ